jgi:hypothetical protein
MPEPAKKPPSPDAPKMVKLPTPAELAAEKLGPQEGLLVLERNTRALAEYYLARYGLTEPNPDTQTTAMLAAIVRRNEHLLLTNIEEDLHRMVLDDQAGDAGEALMKVTMNGKHKELNRELKRLHLWARDLLDELEEEGQRLAEARKE